jgi:hypothetical protein
MPLRIDRVDAEIEILRKPASGAGASDSSVAPGAGGGSETASAVSGRSALRDKLRPIVLEILDEELARIKRRVGSP